MLILSRKIGESIVIDGRIIVKIVRLDGDMVKLGIEAPAEVPVHRQEVYEEIQKNNQEAMTNTKVQLPRLAPPISKNKAALADAIAGPAPSTSRMIIPTAQK
jgi:carbon storage regulator